MSTCDWCGGPRINGSIVTKTEGGFKLSTDSWNPVAQNQRALCRSCTKDALDGQDD